MKNFKKPAIAAALLIGVGIALLFHWLGGKDSGGSNDPQALTETIIGQLGTAISMYKADCGSFPKEDGWMKELTEKGACATWKGPYTDRNVNVNVNVKDSWDREFQYKSDGVHAEIRSFGADGKLGGSGQDQDVVVQVD